MNLDKFIPEIKIIIGEKEYIAKPLKIGKVNEFNEKIEAGNYTKIEYIKDLAKEVFPDLDINSLNTYQFGHFETLLTSIAAGEKPNFENYEVKKK